VSVSGDCGAIAGVSDPGWGIADDRGPCCYLRADTSCDPPNPSTESHAFFKLTTTVYVTKTAMPAALDLVRSFRILSNTVP